MQRAGMIAACALAAMLWGPSVGAQPAAEAGKYPDMRGQWHRGGAGAGGGARYDPAKPAFAGQDPPLTAEYQAVWEANQAEARSGGQTYNGQAHCLPGGMPQMMTAYDPMEVVVTPELTYVLISFNNEIRRIFTDGREWPADPLPSFPGYSIGKWIDEDGDGRYDVLEVETRAFKGPRTYDASGIPTHKDNQTVVLERIYLDRANPDVLHDDITTIDHALTKPWVVNKTYRRVRNPTWVEVLCAESNQYVFLNGDTYEIGPDGYLKPAKNDQPPPDLRHFKGTQR